MMTRFPPPTSFLPLLAHATSYVHTYGRFVECVYMTDVCVYMTDVCVYMIVKKIPHWKVYAIVYILWHSGYTCYYARLSWVRFYGNGSVLFVLEQKDWTK